MNHPPALPVSAPRMAMTLAVTAAAVSLLTSCGPPPASSPQPRPADSSSSSSSSNSAPQRGTSRPADPPDVPGFEILTDGHSLRLPSGPVLAAHWDEVRQLILARPAGSHRDAMLCTAISALAATDPALAGQALADWKNAIPSDWAKAARAVAQALCAQNPDAAMEFIEREVPSSRQSEIWPILLGGMPPDQAAARLDLTNPNTAKLRAAATILTNWTTHDPPAAAAWLDKLGTTLSPGQLKIVAAPNYFVGFQNGAPKFSFLEASRQAFEAARHPVARKIFADDYLRAAAREQPALLADITAEVEKQLAASDAADLSRGAALTQVRDDPPAWFAALTEDEIRSMSPRFLSEALQVWTQKDTPAATRWAVARRLTDQVGAGVGRWYSMDRAAALSYVSSMPASEIRDCGMLELCDRFSGDQNFEAAEKCLGEIVDPKLKDQGMVRLAGAKERAARGRGER